MAFNSIDYLLFLAIIYAFIRSGKLSLNGQHRCLLFASFVFYGAWYPPHLLILIYSGLSDHWIAQKMESSHQPRIKKNFLYLSIANNLGILFTFKYSIDFIETINALTSWTPWAIKIGLPQLMLPVGISFFTFQTMSYAIDVYRGNLKAVNSRIEFMLFVSFFPQLVAGPILRASQFIPQMKNKFKWDETLFFTGVFFILMGLFKKVCLADPLGIYIVDPIYSSAGSRSSIDILIATYAYSFQIFNDFSGYSDIAMGSAFILGFRIPHNFDSPFYSINPAEFWNRWHISLSHWVRDYLYFPMCVSKGYFKGRLQFNLFITVLIIGVWHGSEITFALFGIYHGLLSISHRYATPYLRKWTFLNQSKLGVFIKWFCFFHIVIFSDIIFRAGTLHNFISLMDDLFLNPSFNFTLPPSGAIFVLICAFILHSIRAKHYDQLSMWFSESSVFKKIAFCWLFILPIALCHFITQSKQAFIYFQF